MRFVLAVIVSIIATTATASQWIPSNLIGKNKIAESSVSPIWQCTYRVGETGNYTFSIRVAKQECPQVVFYNIETNKWSLELPMDIF